MENIKKQIDMVINNSNGESFDEAYHFFKLIYSKEIEIDKQIELFQYVCENFGLNESDEEYKIEPSPYKAEKDELKKQYGQIVNSILKSCLKENLEKKEFYTKLWRSIVESFMFSDEKSKVFALYYIIIDKRIPYFQLDNECKYSLANDKYKKMRNKYKQDTLKIRFILGAEFEQKTEKASTLLNEFGIKKPDADAEQCVIDSYEKHLMQMVELMPEKAETDVLGLLQRLRSI